MKTEINNGNGNTVYDMLLDDCSINGIKELTQTMREHKHGMPITNLNKTYNELVRLRNSYENILFSYFLLRSKNSSFPDTIENTLAKCIYAKQEYFVLPKNQYLDIKVKPIVDVIEYINEVLEQGF